MKYNRKRDATFNYLINTQGRMNENGAGPRVIPEALGVKTLCLSVWGGRTSVHVCVCERVRENVRERDRIKALQN